MINLRSISMFITAIACVLLVCGVDQIFGRKCVCTSKACKESGAKTCRTRYSCYTELIFSGDIRTVGSTTASAIIKTTRGCTEGATPLLCETKSWRSSDEDNPSVVNSLEFLGRLAWPRLICCDSHNYCNAADEDFEPTDRPEYRNGLESGLNLSANDYSAEGTINAGGIANGDRNVQPVHFAALVLSIAAFISVLAACYVVTRFLNASGNIGTGLPRIIGPAYGNRLDF